MAPEGGVAVRRLACALGALAAFAALALALAVALLLLRLLRRG